LCDEDVIVRAGRAALTFILVATCLSPLAAQQRELQRYELDTPEGRLMGFYSSALASNPLGSPFKRDASRWSIELALELGYIPHLNSEQRTAGFDKPEASNLSPILPRPRISIAFPGQLTFDASWLPPLKVLDGKANLAGLSVRRDFTLGAGLFSSITPRLSFLVGRVRGAITCSEDLATGSLDDQFYYADVCHARSSDDYFDPTHIALDLSLNTGPHLLGATSYYTAGLRREFTSFDIGVIQGSGERDLDHPILKMSATRFFTIAGLEWSRGPSGRARYLIEFNYTPGSLVTARALVGWRIK
jgi:hypothetical protein